MSDRSDVQRSIGPGDSEEFQRLLDRFFDALAEASAVAQLLKDQTNAGILDVGCIGGLGRAGARLYNRWSAIERFLGK